MKRKRTLNRDEDIFKALGLAVKYIKVTTNEQWAILKRQVPKDDYEKIAKIALQRDKDAEFIEHVWFKMRKEILNTEDE